MFIIDKAGMIVSNRVKPYAIAGLAKGKLGVVHGIVVHQTGGATAAAAFAGYKARPFGTHFLIDKDGTIYQTASLLYFTEHVGLLKPRCLAEHRCTPVEAKLYAPFNPKLQSRMEKSKAWPARYPMSKDSIGIELVGEFNKSTKSYIQVTAKQNASMSWLIKEISASFRVSMNEIFRHPDLSWKEPTEGKTATW